MRVKESEALFRSTPFALLMLLQCTLNTKQHLCPFQIKSPLKVHSLIAEDLQEYFVANSSAWSHVSDRLPHLTLQLRDSFSKLSLGCFWKLGVETLSEASSSVLLVLVLGNKRAESSTDVQLQFFCKNVWMSTWKLGTSTMRSPKKPSKALIWCQTFPRPQIRCR